MDLSGWIERWAEQAPAKCAIHFDGIDIGYADFARRIDRLARALKSGLDVGAGDRVAHLGLNSPELLDLVFACARLGAMVVPLNWRLAPPEHRFMLADCAPKAVLVEPAFVDHMAEVDPAGEALRTVCYGAAPPGWLAYDSLLAEATGDGRADHDGYRTPVLLVYTSGTTGRPKGAVLTQKAIFWNAINSTHAHDLTSADQVLTNIPMFHVGGLNIQTLPALHAGATVNLQTRFDPARTLQAIARRRPTLALLVPAMMQALIDHPDWAATDLSSLRGVMAGSSAVPAALIRGFTDRGVPVGQIYGTTETAPIAIYLRLPDATRRIGSCGKSAVHCDIRLVDDRGRDVAAGAVGEILVRGPNIFREYWGDRQATAAALRDGWFHTGDIGHRDDEGYYFIDDRKKDVVISGGENVYPAELEDVMADAPAIAEAAVVGRADAQWGEVAVAFVVARPGMALTAADVLALFQGRLARYKHPRAVIFVDTLPRNAMGKVLKHELRARLARRET